MPSKRHRVGERDGHFFPKALFVAKTKVGEFFLKTYPEMLPDYICKEKHTLSFCERYIIDYQAKIPGNPTAWPCCGCAPKETLPAGATLGCGWWIPAASAGKCPAGRCGLPLDETAKDHGAWPRAEVHRCFILGDLKLVQQMGCFEQLLASGNMRCVMFV